jgi:hypothetical protein
MIAKTIDAFRAMRCAQMLGEMFDQMLRELELASRTCEHVDAQLRFGRGGSSPPDDEAADPAGGPGGRTTTGLYSVFTAGGGGAGAVAGPGGSTTTGLTSGFATAGGCPSAAGEAGGGGATGNGTDLGRGLAFADGPGAGHPTGAFGPCRGANFPRSIILDASATDIHQ